MKQFVVGIQLVNKYTLVAFAFCLFILSGCNRLSDVSFPKYELVLTNTPGKVSATASVNVLVASDWVSKYKYKIGPVDSTDCSAESGYSAESYNSSAPIVKDLSAFPDQQMLLCVLGFDAQGVQQLYKDAKAVTWFIDRVQANITFVENEQSALESDTALKVLTIKTNIVKPYPITVRYKLKGTAGYMLDQTLPNEGTVVLPANASSVTIPFQILNNSSSLVSSYFRATIAETDVDVVVPGVNYTSTFFITDTDSGVKPVASSFAIDGNTTCAILNDGQLKCWGRNDYGQVGGGALASAIQSTPVLIDNGTTYSKVVTSHSTTCGITIAGVLKCWGRNANGQLGDGTLVDKYTPTVIDSGTSYTQISTNSSTTCGITSGDVLKCWGLNTSGQVGDTTIVQKTTPTVIDLGVSYSSVVTDSSTTCGLVKTTGVLKCWGLNTSGQVGIGSTTNRTSPAIIDSSASYSAFSVGSNTTCGITAGVLKCWGLNSKGQVGDTTVVNKTSPIIVTDGSADIYSKVTTYGLTTCAITTTGILKCWGYNGYGQLGDNTTVDQKVPIIVDSGFLYTSVVLEGNSRCGITTSQVLKCSGRNDVNQLGDGTGTLQKKSVVIDPGVSYAKIFARYYVMCGITTAGESKCWGLSNNGPIGDGSAGILLTPTLADTDKYKLWSKSNYTSCGVTTSDSLKCTGSNATGSVGDGTNIDKINPVLIDKGTKYKVVLAAYDTTCAITVGGVLKCWGNNANGRLGIGSTTNVNTPTVVDSGVSYSSIDGNSGVFCGLTTTGIAKCWGSNGLGSVGDGTTIDKLTPTIVDSGTLYTALNTMNYTTCGVTVAGVLKCWGQNTNGSAGDGTGLNYSSPRVINAGTAYSKIYACGGTRCGITTGNALKCWGPNSFGQVGVASPTTVLSPVLIDSGVSYQSVSLLNNTTCGITTGNALKCWGQNSVGEVGDGTQVHRSAPVLVDAGTSYTKAAPSYHSCFITTAGVLKCVGDNTYSQLGIGVVNPFSLPFLVVDAGVNYVDVMLDVNNACGITAAGNLKCWGRNENAQGVIGSDYYRGLPRSISNWLSP